MKFQYFLRGLGTGIVFAAIIFVIAYNGKANQLSDDEIIKKAKGLGMVEADDQIGMLIEEQNNSTEQASQNTTQTDDKKTEQSDALEEDKDVTEAATEQKEETSEVEEFELVVNYGVSSYPVCQQLESFGLIDNAEEFDNYLIEHGYANRISVGTHILRKGMTKEEIAVAISDKKISDKK